MTKEDKAKWKCAPCIRISRDINTPLTTRSRVLSPICNDNTPQSNYTLNVSTENSFESLDSEETEDCTEIHTLNRSCPDLRLNSLDNMEQLQNKVLELQEKLQIADNQIDILVQENYQLKDDVIKCELKIKQLSKICKSDFKNVTHRKKLKTSKKTQLDFSVQDGEQSLIKDKISDSITFDKNLNSNTSSQNPNTTEMQQKTDSLHLTPTNDAGAVKQPNPKHKLIVVGDERLTGLSADLLESRRGKWNDVYAPSASIMPNARSSQILDYCSKLDENLTKDDVLILGIGTYDKNPEQLCIDLCVLLSKLKTPQIVILPVLSNRYLNVKTLNNHLKLWTRGFENCLFLEDRDRIPIGNRGYLNSICFKINILLDSRQYEKQFLNLESLRILLKSRHVETKNPKNPSPHKHRKGTIPYYFGAKTPAISEQKSISPPANNIPANKPKKGTIPYYFPNTNRNSIDGSLFFRTLPKN